jgi:hypothetical protein
MGGRNERGEGERDWPGAPVSRVASCPGAWADSESQSHRTDQGNSKRSRTVGDGEVTYAGGRLRDGGHAVGAAA